jgi:predicted enzyme related to lactoylglutathione lyase
MPRPIHFEIPAENPERAIRFYSSVLGWTFTKWDGPVDYWIVTTGDASEPGINGGLMPRRDPAQPCVNTVNVSDLDAMIQKVESSGGLCVVPKMPVPGIGWLAYCKDTEGHIFGMMQPDPTAHM